MEVIEGEVDWELKAADKFNDLAVFGGGETFFEVVDAVIF